MNRINIEFSLNDNGGRRSGFDRRRFAYDGHIPERRLIEDRRRGTDRRSGYDRRDFFSDELAAQERRSYTDRRAAWN